MSQQNVELVLGLQSAPDVDLARRFRDDAMWAATLEALDPIFHADFEFSLPLFGTSETVVGREGLRAAYLDWLAPWATYRVEIEESDPTFHDFATDWFTANEGEWRPKTRWTTNGSSRTTCCRSSPPSALADHDRGG